MALQHTDWQPYGNGGAGRYLPYGRPGGSSSSSGAYENLKAAGLLDGTAFGGTRAGQSRSFNTMPSYAELLNMGLAAGTTFTVNGVNFVWNGRDVQAADEEGNAISASSKLADAYQEAMDQANAVNEERFGTIDVGHETREADVMGLLEGMGDTARRGIYERGRATESQRMQHLVDTGLYNSTNVTTLMAGTSKRIGEEEAELDERLRGQQAGALMGLRGDRLAFQERREDVQPDYAQLALLAGDLGQWGAGGRGIYGQAYNQTAGGGYGRPSSGSSLPVGDPGWNFGAVEVPRGGGGGGGGGRSSSGGGMFGDLWGYGGWSPYTETGTTGASDMFGNAGNQMDYGGYNNVAAGMPAVSGPAGAFAGNSTGFVPGHTSKVYGSNRFANNPNAVTIAQQPYGRPRFPMGNR